ncbi:RNA dependent RNA polymerase-domain-containing protein [Boletus edulis BED1]|uniref:RNA dependent RNA polymerase-domain-containing protein n=1 Tax=Boletus edulis BED1 TaxID=1328754 RepID=A0AAD4GEH1_BOLED|nr:RNA dependent RNA polymerase-domain-containing protein [Boletus edulis BED1]
MYTLLQNPTQDQESWRFTVPNNHFALPRRRNEKNIYGKFIKFTADAITLEMSQFPSSRILRSDDPSKFLLVSFEKLRFPEGGLRVTADYITRMMKAGVFINGVQYRFYHHSNSQLRSRTCFMRVANNDVELDDRIYKLGDFGRIMNAAKRAKRIGLLFSAAELDIQLDPKWTTDMEDIENPDTVFSDGCGLMSKHWAIQVSKTKKIIFRNQRYVPCVLQIRYLGYKGVLMMHPEMDKEKKYLAKFRKSMKKFTTTQDHSFSVVGYSKPYAFGRLNNDIIVLLSSLGVTNEKLVAKQEAYFRWIEEASTDVAKAVDFASCLDQYDVAERVLLNGLDDPTVSAQIRRVQMAEISQFLKNERPRARMIIHKSRLLYGVCDPFKVLKEGQVHIRITSQKGATTPINGDVLVVRNPCLHPGDCLKLRAVSHPSLDHLPDCIVFASVAKPKHQAAPSMSSGGDLDGDKFFVCWDPDVVPPRSYDYPPNKERPGGNVTRQDLATHFAMYNNVGLAQITKLHQQWIRGSPKGAMSPECQELNALHSRSVDGARVRIPERLRKPPATEGPFILDILADAAEKFRTRFTTRVANELDPATTSPEDAEDVLAQLFKNKPEAVSEYELFSMAVAFARKYSINLFELKPYLAHLDFGALAAHEKHVISTTLGLSPTEHRRMWNSLLTSDILSMRDLQQRQLDRPLSMQRLYSSAEKSTATFFQYLQIAFEQYTRKLLILKTDDRFAVGIFVKGVTLWDEDPEVDENVVVCSFMPKATESMSVYRPCTAGYRLHCSDGNLQLYDKHMANTFVFISRSRETGNDVIASIALQKISKRVGQQLGRLNKAPVTSIEIHVISNRDRVAHQLFDMYLEHVQTEEYVRRFARELTPYNVKSVRDVDWSAHPEWMKDLFVPRNSEEMMFKQLLSDLQHQQLQTLMTFALQHRADNELYWTFDFIVALQPLVVDMIITCLHQNPALVYVLLRAYPPTESLLLPEQLVDLKVPILRAILRSANSLGVATLVALEKISQSVNNMEMSEYAELLMLAALSIRPKTLLQETLLVLHESTSASREGSPATAYLHKHALAVAFDCAEEAADTCPCDDTGRPRSTKSSYPVLRLVQAEDGAEGHVDVHFRVDLSVPIRLHSHVRLQCVSDPENAFIDRAVVDGVVTKSGRGEITVEMFHTLPPEFAVMQWRIFDAGSLATARAMMDALTKLWQDSYECCSIYDTIVMPPPQTASGAVDDHLGEEDELVGTELMNPSQIIAIRSSLAPLSLIWGHQTTVVVQILRYLLRKFPDCKILMTASTHDAVDNVLERFLELNREHRLLSDDLILRVATDHSKVSKALQSYTIDARVGGDLHENSRLQRQAQQRVNAARIVFTTCAGAGLGTLRKIDFDTVLIDEASQLTEPTALIPLVKRCQRAVLVGDHVQLRPTVKPMGKVLEYDVSLMERLYTSNAHPGTAKTMLNVQYRFPSELADFPSTEFYHGELQSHIQDSAPVLARLAATAFPWPRVGQGQRLVPTAFVQCASEETTGSASKGNEGQVELAARIIALLQQPQDQDQDGAQAQSKLTIAALSPYAKQVSLLKSALPSSVTCATIDAFQGRESDVVVFSSVRCNVTREIGFVDDPRRLNVMWTRARIRLDRYWGSGDDDGDKSAVAKGYRVMY